MGASFVRTLPKLLLSLVFGDSSTKKNNWETNPLDLNEPDSQVCACPSQ